MLPSIASAVAAPAAAAAPPPARRRRDQDPERVFPLDFRSPVGDDEALGSAGDESGPAGPLLLRFSCACGQCAFEAEVSDDQPPVRCHCVSCRRFHTTAFAAFAPVAAVPAALGGAAVGRYADRCHEVGQVERIFCGQCRSTLATTVVGGGQTLLALGCLDDESLPPAVAVAWQRSFVEWQAAQRAGWWSLRPCAGSEPSAGSVLELRGGCACGGAAYRSVSGSSLQLQHCFCKLCRQLSGSVGQTWIPVPRDGFEWVSQETLELVRTTSHGQRHQCNRCGGVRRSILNLSAHLSGLYMYSSQHKQRYRCRQVLTIIYDGQPDAVWPVAGTVSDESMTLASGQQHVSRVIHICCSMMQGWYQLPDDGLPRLRFAG